MAISAAAHNVFKEALRSQVADKVRKDEIAIFASTAEAVSQLSNYPKAIATMLDRRGG